MNLLQSKGNSRKTVLELGASAGNNEFYKKKNQTLYNSVPIKS
ncbi:MAG: hypothetical protein SFU98_10510 [Leptospiraceae bacterium]|nr:hypothetical protein [Leptospiraceae bacterium]